MIITDIETQLKLCESISELVKSFIKDFAQIIYIALNIIHKSENLLRISQKIPNESMTVHKNY